MFLLFFFQNTHIFTFPENAYSTEVFLEIHNSSLSLKSH